MRSITTTSTQTAARDCGCPDYSVSRRHVLAGALAGGAGLVTSRMFGDTFQQVAYGAPAGGNVLVVLSLRGGCDGLSLVVPRGADNDVLMSARPQIGVPQQSLIGGDARFGLHPAMQPLQSMWDAGRFGAVHAVGLPTPNRSHFQAIEQVEAANPGTSKRVGWLNRLIGVTDPSPEDAVQLGSGMLPTALMGPAPAVGANSLADFQLQSVGAGRRQTKRGLKLMWDREPGDVGRAVRLTMRASKRLSSVAEDPSTSGFPDGPLRSPLANTASLIKADIGTRVVTLDYGDWDMHVGQGRPDSGWFRDHTRHLAESLAAFFTGLGSHADRVTLVTVSEFGRRVQQNGAEGTDHGYGNAMLVLGAGVRGGQVAGKWPGLDQLDEGDVRLGQDYRSVLWEVVRKRYPELGASQAKIFPGFTPEGVGIMA